MLEKSIDCTFAQKFFAHQVRRHNCIQRLRIQHHPTRHSVHKHFVVLHIREVLSHFSGNLIPHHHAVALCVTFGNNRNVLFWPALCCFEGKAEQTLYTMASEDRNFSCNLPWLASVRSASLAGVLTFGILAHNDPVQVAVLGVAQGGRRSTKDFCRSNVSILLEGLTDS